MPTSLRPVVWDCFTFHDELALLDFRLRLLDPVVDHFVLIEATRTFSGEPKSASFAENAGRFGAFASKMRHVLVHDMPVDAISPWVRERFQHAAIWRGLDGLAPDDLVMVGDVDEIPDPAVVRDLRSTLQGPTRLVMRHFAFAANFELPEAWTDGTIAARGHQLEEPQMALLMGDARAVWSAENDHLLPDAGYHLSFLGGEEAVAAKLRAYSHQELAGQSFCRQRHIERCVTLGVHVAGGYTIRRRREEQLPPSLRALAEIHPHLFDFRPDASRVVVRLYQAYARMGRGLPPWLLNVVDGHPLPFAFVFGPFVVAADAAVQKAVKHRLRRRTRRAVDASRRVIRRIDGTAMRRRAAGG